MVFPGVLISYIKAGQTFGIYVLNGFRSGLGNYELWVIFRSGSVGFFFYRFGFSWRHLKSLGIPNQFLVKWDHAWCCRLSNISGSCPTKAVVPLTPNYGNSQKNTHKFLKCFLGTVSENCKWKLHRELVQLLVLASEYCNSWLSMWQLRSFLRYIKRSLLEVSNYLVCKVCINIYNFDLEPDMDFAFLNETSTCTSVK